MQIQSSIGKPETQTLEEFAIGSFALGVFGQHKFSVSIDTWKTGDPTCEGDGGGGRGVLSVIGSWDLGCVFGELEQFIIFS